MTAPNRWQVVLAGLTVALLACEDSITGVADPQVDFEATTSVALLNGSCHEPPDGLISWWPAEGTEDERFDDIVPLADGMPDPNHIALVSLGHGIEGQSTPGGRIDPRMDPYLGTVGFDDNGKVGQAFSFTSAPPDDLNGLVTTGGVQFLEIRDADPDLRPANFTIDLWAMRTDTGQNGDDPFGNVLITKPLSDGPNNPDPRSSYDIYWNKAGKIRARVNLVGGSVILDSQTDFSAEDVWVHIALTVDVTVNGSTVRLYVNGVEVPDSPVVGGGSVKYGDGSVVMGSSYRFSRLRDYPRGFHGLIDEVDIFGRALDEGEILDIYEAGSAGKCTITNNTAPMVTAGPYDDISEGDTFEPTVSFADVDSEFWDIVVNFGDPGSDDNVVSFLGVTDLNMSLDLSHTYAQDATYTVTVTVTDNEGAEDSSPHPVVVLNEKPLVNVATVVEGPNFEGEGYCVDPGADSWTATVDYGDGSGEQELTLTGTPFQLSHTYACAGPGPVPVTVTVRDDDESGTESVQVSVIHQISVSRASVKLDRRGRRSRDQLDVSGRLPRSLIECLSREDEVSIEFGDLEWTLPPRSLRHRNRWWQKKWYFTGRGSHPIRRLDFHDNGRFTIQVRRGELRGLSGLIPFSISFGPDSGETEVRIRGRRGRSDRGRSDKSGKSDKSGRSGKSGRSRR
jgi:hypothetical protein